jgi:hypothetical protein
MRLDRKADLRCRIERYQLPTVITVMELHNPIGGNKSMCGVRPLRAMLK